MRARMTINTDKKKEVTFCFRRIGTKKKPIHSNDKPTSFDASWAISCDTRVLSAIIMVNYIATHELKIGSEYGSTGCVFCYRPMKKKLPSVFQIRPIYPKMYMWFAITFTRLLLKPLTFSVNYINFMIKKINFDTWHASTPNFSNCLYLCVTGSRTLQKRRFILSLIYSHINYITKKLMHHV